MNTQYDIEYDTIDETYLKTKLNLCIVKDENLLEFSSIFYNISYSNNPNKIKLIECFFDLLIYHNKIKDFLMAYTTNDNILEQICILNNDDLFNKIISLYEENNLLHLLIVDKNNLKNRSDAQFNTIIYCLLMLQIDLTDNILVKFSEIIDKYYVSELIKNENYNQIIDLCYDIFSIMQLNRIKFIENMIEIYIKYDILDYLTKLYTITNDELVYVSIFSDKIIIENLSDNIFEQLIINTFSFSNHNYVPLVNHIIKYDKLLKTNKISERYMIIYKKLKDKIGMDQILNILNEYNVSKELIDYIIHNMKHDIKNAEI